MGKIIWSRVYKVADSAIARSLVETSDGGFLLAGDAYKGLSNSGVLLKADSMGSQNFAKIYSREYGGRFYGAVQLSDGTYVAAGLLSYSVMAGDENIWILKVDPEGDVLVDKTFGSLDEKNNANAIANTSDGGFIVTGLTLSKSTGSLSAPVLRFDRDCNLYWTKRFPEAEAYSIKQTSDGGFILSGHQPIEGSKESKVYLLRIDPDGNKIWDNTYQTVYVPLKSDVIETADHGFIAVGKQFVMKVDGAGNVIWNRSYNDSFFSALALTASDELAVGGSYLDRLDFDHAYLALLTGDGKSMIWDNTETLYPSGFAGVVVTARDNIVAGGDIPQNNNGKALLLRAFK